MAEIDDTTSPEGEPELEEPAKPKRVVGKPFAPGNKANPGGRPKTDERVRAALDALTPTAVAELRRLLKDKTTPRKIRAQVAMYVVDRKLGKPTTQITAEGSAFAPPAIPPDSPIGRLLALARAKQAEQGPAENAPQEPSGAATRTLPGQPS